MKTSIKTIDLNNLKDENLWAKILKMVVPGWTAGWTFRLVKEGFGPRIKLKLLYADGEPIAWNALVDNRRNGIFNEVWAFTKPEFRQMGLQKKLLKITARYHKGLKFYAEDKRQRATFKHYEQKKLVAGAK